MEKQLTLLCTLKQLISGPQSQHLFAISPSCSLPGGPLQPTESCLLSPHFHIPVEEHQSLIVRLFGFLLIKYSTYKVLNKYIAVSDTSVPYTPTWRALCIYIRNIMESYLPNAKQATE